MEGPKRSNWADDSDEDLSEEEQPPKIEEAPQQSQSVTLSSSQPIKSLSSKIESAYPPYTLRLFNISYDLRDENELYEFFGLTDEEIDEISIEMHRNERNQFKGSATLKMPNKEIALKIAKKDGDLLRNRDLSIYLDDGSQDGSRRRGRGRGDRGDRGERRGERRNNGRGRYQQPQRSRYNNNSNYEPRKEEKPKERPKIINSGKIVIAPSSEQHPKVEEEKLPPPPPPKPKSNPFGNAKPIDTLAKELEFEKKRQQEEEEKRKEYEEKYEENYEDYEQEEPEEGEIIENPVESQEKPEDKVEEVQERPQRYVKKSPRKEEPKVEEKTEEIKIKKPKAWGNDEETKKILSSAPPPVEVKPKTQYNSYKQGRHEKSGGRQGKYRVKQPRAQETNNE